MAQQQMEMTRSKLRRLFVVAGVVLVLDQATKILILNYFPLYHTVSVLPGFFNLTHVHNPGGAFGVLSGSPSLVRHIFFLLASSAALVVVLFLYFKTPGRYRLLSAGLALIFGGALGNLTDRIRLGKVVDFLDFYIRSFHWPAFNIADSAISIGMVVFVYHLLMGKLPE